MPDSQSTLGRMGEKCLEEVCAYAREVRSGRKSFQSLWLEGAGLSFLTMARSQPSGPGPLGGTTCPPTTLHPPRIENRTGATQGGPPVPSITQSRGLAAALRDSQAPTEMHHNYEPTKCFLKLWLRGRGYTPHLLLCTEEQPTEPQSHTPLVRVVGHCS